MMNRQLALILGGTFLAASLFAQDPDKRPSTPAAPTATDGVAKPVAESEYRIGPQDVVRIDVWKEPDISRTIPVRPDGKISLPLLNDVQASGLTSMQLAGSIREGLTKYLTNPQVTVTVTEINSRRVFITGMVGQLLWLLVARFICQGCGKRGADVRPHFAPARMGTDTN
jgi:protein involved in polysaccharide export with SLBB domain